MYILHMATVSYSYLPTLCAIDCDAAASDYQYLTT